MRVEDVEGVELKMKRGGPPLEVVPVVFVDGKVDEFFWGWEVRGVVDGFFLVYFIPGERDGGGLDFDLSKVLDNVVEDFQDACVDVSAFCCDERVYWGGGIDVED